MKFIIVWLRAPLQGAATWRINGMMPERLADVYSGSFKRTAVTHCSFPVTLLADKHGNKVTSIIANRRRRPKTIPHQSGVTSKVKERGTPATTRDASTVAYRVQPTCAAGTAAPEADVNAPTLWGMASPVDCYATVSR